MTFRKGVSGNPATQFKKGVSGNAAGRLPPKPPKEYVDAVAPAIAAAVEKPV